MRSCPELVILRRGVLFSNGQALCRRASFREAKRIGVSILRVLRRADALHARGSGDALRVFVVISESGQNSTTPQASLCPLPPAADMRRFWAMRTQPTGGRVLPLLPLRRRHLGDQSCTALEGDVVHSQDGQHRHSPLPDQSTTLRVDSSSTDDSRLRGALPLPDSCTAANLPLHKGSRRV